MRSPPRLAVALSLAALCACRSGLWTLGAPPDAASPSLPDAGAPDLYVPACGNGYLDPGESCDDGNLFDDDACRADCTRSRCGDGVLWRGVEYCDDGNTIDDSTCKGNCGPPLCGDGVATTPEQCDDGNLDPGDSCLNSCVTARCGDSFVERGVEQCDDGNQLDTDACVSGCRLARCGDGFVERGVEQCDDGNPDPSDSCLPSCLSARCGDGVVWRGVEACDDGNSDNTDGCVAGCRLARCGDGFVERGVEACDDGNSDDTDACVAGCRLARCGDGFVERGVEQCDDGNQVEDDACDNLCRLPVCGDGRRAGAEQCDLGKDNGDRPAFLVTQPSGTRIATNPLVQRKDSVSFYSYSSASSHTGFEQVGESRIYLYVDSNTGRLSLVLTHGIDLDSSGKSQPASAVDMDVSGIPPGFTIDVSDDPGEFFATSPTTAAGRWTFNQNSDGGVLGGLPFPGVWKITVGATFQQGINTWGWVRDDLTRVPMKMGETITIEAFDEATACRRDCTTPRCGDGILDGGEICDDHNNVGGDGCAADCKSLR